MPTLDGLPLARGPAAASSARSADLVASTGARGAELRAARAGDVDLVARVGGEDPLLTGLIDLALDQNTAQVVEPPQRPARRARPGAPGRSAPPAAAA